MPRSEAASDDSYEDESSSCEDSSLDDDVDSRNSDGNLEPADREQHDTMHEPEAAPARSKQAPEEAASGGIPTQAPVAVGMSAFLLKKASFVDELVTRVCWKMLDWHLRQLHPVRQAATQLRESRERHCRDPARSLQRTVEELLPPDRAEDLELMAVALRGMCEGDIPDNDRCWLHQLGSGPLPPRTVAMQRLQRAVFASVREQGGSDAASWVSHTSVELARNALYVPSVELLWPLLSSTQRLEVQQWFANYAELHASASGSVPSGLSSSRAP